MDETFVALVRKHFPLATVVAVERYRKGVMNATYKVVLANPTSTVVYREYARDDWKAAKEQYLYTLIRDRTTVPVPEVLAKGKNYSILSYVDGKELDITNKELVRLAGKQLAKLHSLRMPSFGWIIGNEIKPSFGDWESFLRFDTEHKLSKLPRSAEHDGIRKKIRGLLYGSRSLLQINDVPCLVHKDYHASHILVSDNVIAGIIDVEWAIAGHHELDLVKSCDWMFSGDSMEEVFLDGYRSEGTISDKFEDRKKLYRILILLSSLVISYDCNNAERCHENRAELQKLLGL